jgi:hypothetical protein
LKSERINLTKENEEFKIKIDGLAEELSEMDGLYYQD